LKEVPVIGMGAVSALGVGLATTAEQLRLQRVAPHPVTRFASTLKTPVRRFFIGGSMRYASSFRTFSMASQTSS